MTIYSLDVLLSQFWTSLLFHVKFELLLPDLHTDVSRGRSGDLVFPSLSEFSSFLLQINKPFSVLVLILLNSIITNITYCVAYKQQKFIFHRSGSLSRGTSMVLFWWGPSSWFTASTPCVLTGLKRWRISLGLFYEDMNSAHEGSTPLT